MNYQYAIPAPALQPYIRQYWAMDNVLDPGLVHRQRIIPTGLPELTFYFGQRPEAVKRSLVGNALLSAQHNDYYDLLITGRLSFFSVTFQPEGLSRFLHIPVSELLNQTVCWGDTGCKLTQQTEQQLQEAKSFAERIRIIETYLLGQVATQNITTDYKRMQNIIAHIRYSGGNIAIDTLAAEACLSRKQFERRFSASIGTSPKQYLKIIRFQHAIYRSMQPENENLAAVAYDTGYYDQSHFIKEIKELTGHTPKQLFGNARIESDFFR